MKEQIFVGNIKKDDGSEYKMFLVQSGPETTYSASEMNDKSEQVSSAIREIERTTELGDAWEPLIEDGAKMQDAMRIFYDNLIPVDDGN